MLGSAIAVGYRLVVVVFWYAPPGMGICGRQSVDNCRVVSNQIIQVNQGRGSQPYNTPGRMAGFSLVMVLFTMVSQWWRLGVSPLIPGLIKPFHKTLVIPGSGNAR
jgi:hypothetical protein